MATNRFKSLTFEELEKELVQSLGDLSQKPFEVVLDEDGKHMHAEYYRVPIKLNKKQISIAKELNKRLIEGKNANGNE